jgi:hypothetical protein
MIPRGTRDPATLGVPDNRDLFWVTRRAARFALYALHAAALLAIAVEIARPLDADGHGIERVAALDFPASYALYGFVACVVLVVLGRGLRRLVIRDERYYERER